MRIAFCWTGGVRDRARFNHWNDGLRQAMRLIEDAGHEVTYHEPDEDLPTVDWILFWESPITIDSPVYGNAYKKVMHSPQKKALLFSGGPIKSEWVEGFDHIFVESKVNKDEFDTLGIRNSTAFGVNTDVFKPIETSKDFKTVTQGTCASWKRQWLVAEAMGDNALVFGQAQDADPYAFVRCRELGAHVLLEQTYEDTNRLLNSAEVGVNCADKWGGGQRATLECMAVGLPIVVMNDSPKNIEYVEGAGVGEICNPNGPDIKKAVERAMEYTQEDRDKIQQYVLDHWTPEHYKNAILNGICQI
jgi:hypothetical protein